jgi:hypothetical protein
LLNNSPEFGNTFVISLNIASHNVHKNRVMSWLTISKLFYSWHHFSILPFIWRESSFLVILSIPSVLVEMVLLIVSLPWSNDYSYICRNCLLEVGLTFSLLCSQSMVRLVYSRLWLYICHHSASSAANHVGLLCSASLHTS